MPKPLTHTRIKALVEAQFPGAWEALKPVERRELAEMLNAHRAKQSATDEALGKMFAAMRRKR